MRLYADIIINISHENLDKTFQYYVPEELTTTIAVGDRVVVPFGSGNRTISGFVLELSDKPKIDESRIKGIVSIQSDDTLVEEKLIKLAYWMKSRYGSTMNHALKTVLPIKKNVKKAEDKTVVLNVSVSEANELIATYEKMKNRVARLRLLKELVNEGAIDYKLVTGKLNISSTTVNSLKDAGIINVESKRVYRNTVNETGAYERKQLNPHQQSIADDFTQEYINGKRGTYLLFGITGSGKTEVYMEMIETVIKEGRQVIVLIPEISLTYQTVMRFYKRFPGRVSTLHSKLSEGERYDQFERAKKHEIDIMIGPRSALFTPFDNLGLIVIDEEHENTYKSDNMPKYHAREVAQELAKLHRASVVLGSATPSLESYFCAQNGEYKLYNLKERAGKAKPPAVQIVDLKEELRAGNKSIFSRALKERIEERLRNNEQVMLFLNRRGYAGFVSCRACGEAVKCPHCDVSLSRHREGKLVCHYCGYEQPEVKVCPKCGSNLIGGMRVGTQAVEEAVKKLFPYANVLRMDADTTRKKDDYEKVLSSFANHESDILVGTQMIVKGHDFPEVTLVGILAADLSLNGNDYRAGEKTFELLVQAAGRAGRGNKPGEVIIQTYQSDHYAIQSAKNQDFESFYEEEMGYRNILMYPPGGHMLAILVESKDESAAKNMAHSLAGKLSDDIMDKVVLIGPTEATIKKISDVFRYMIYAKSKERDALVAIKDTAEAYISEMNVKSVRVTFDFDPLSGY